ncbi:MAG: HNH endonuclease [Aeromicrobium sp.]|uniref:HNH endonuclease n=1 Tax=Aeromicrobium sp. TaxID=1871063 RepID=UPI0039E6F314
MRDPLDGSWSGRVVEQARAIVATWLPRPCAKCGEVMDGGTPWVVGHKRSRATHPHLTMAVSNWQVECRPCSDKGGQAVVREKAAAEALAAVFPVGPACGEPPPLPVSPPEGGPTLTQPALPGMPKPPTGEALEVRPELEWDPDRLAEHPWLAEVVTSIPDDASPPLYMSPPPADATGSYGDQVIDWIEREQGITLRWWQRLAVVRQFEHRADGTLTTAVMIDSAPRRAGKSVRMRGVALWRLADPLGLFGEPQLAMHTGSDMAICREIQRGAWRWAESKGWEVTRANGKEAVETPDGNRWLVRSQDGVYGYDVTLGLIDEAWNVKPETVTEGIEPATLERIMPQLLITSTAHRRATSLMRGRISTALASDDPEVVLLVWAAPPGSDPADPAVWRAASPHWSEARRKLISRKYDAALAGQADPEADDPDPLAGFASQYLNVWRLGERKAQRGEPVVTDDDWAGLAAPAPADDPPVAAVESWFTKGVSLALAWQVDGRAVVHVTGHDSLAAVAELLRGLRLRAPVVVGASLADDPALVGVRTQAATGRVAATVQRLGGLIREDGLRHTDTAHLTGQACAVRLVPGADGPRLASTVRADAVKAAVWAADAARALPARRAMRVITARR